MPENKGEESDQDRYPDPQVRVRGPFTRKKFLILKSPKKYLERRTGKRDFRRKRILNMATPNVQGLSTKTKEMEKYKIDIAVLFETKKKGR